MSEKSTYYDIEPILKIPARYRVMFGERSNGKTYAVLKYAFEKHLKDGSELGIVRRYDEDFTGAQSARNIYDTLIHNGEGKNVIEELTGGSYTGVEYYSGIYYLTYVNDKGKAVRSDEIIARAFSVVNAQHYKGSSYPLINTVLFDEFIAERIYLADEFISFEGVLSTIIRQRDNVEIFMCGNTINRYNPYFTEMGLYKAKNMKPGDMDVYEYGDSGLIVAVQFTDTPAKKKKSDVYFAFNNPKLKMITTGDWQLDIYPHCPKHYRPADVVFVFMIIFNEEMLQAEIVQAEDDIFIFIHRKTTDLKKPDTDLIYSQEYDVRLNHRRNLLKPVYDVEKKIALLFRLEKVFYQDNEVGDTVANYLAWCRQN